MDDICTLDMVEFCHLKIPRDGFGRTKLQKKNLNIFSLFYLKKLLRDLGPFLITALEQSNI